MLTRRSGCRQRQTQRLWPQHSIAFNLSVPLGASAGYFDDTNRGLADRCLGCFCLHRACLTAELYCQMEKRGQVPHAAHSTEELMDAVLSRLNQIEARIAAQEMMMAAQESNVCVSRNPPPPLIRFKAKSREWQWRGCEFCVFKVILVGRGGTANQRTGRNTMESPFQGMESQEIR